MILYQEGGVTLPTKQDSLYLMDNVQKRRAYYEDTNRYEPSVSSEFDVYTQDGSVGESSSDRYYKQGDPSYLRAAFKARGSMSSNIQSNNLPEDYYSPQSDYQFYQGDLINTIVDPSAPMILYDTRIKPSDYKSYINTDNADAYEGDIAGHYEYDPIQVTPWDQLDLDQQRQRVSTYGLTGTPFSNMDDYVNYRMQVAPTSLAEPRETVVPMPHLDKRSPTKPTLSLPAFPPRETPGATKSDPARLQRHHSREKGWYWTYGDEEFSNDQYMEYMKDKDTRGILRKPNFGYQ